MRRFLWTVLSLVDLAIFVICFITFQTQQGDGFLGFFYIYPELLLVIGFVRLILVKYHNVGFVNKFQDFLFIPLLILPFFLPINNEQIKIAGQIFMVVAFFTCFTLSIVAIFSEKKQYAK